MNSRLTISLGSLVANYNRLKSAAVSDVAAVVKADAYGLGAAEVSRHLWQQGCREYFVATVEEGMLIRQLLTGAIVYVLEGASADTVDQLLRHQLIPVLNSKAQIEVWQTQTQPCAVHVDSGMHRLGLPFDQAASVLAQRRVQVDLLVTHLARADEVDHSFNQHQQKLLASLAAAIGGGESGGGGEIKKFPLPRISLCNSAAMLQHIGPEDLGRAGIALYGGNPFSTRDNPMAPVVQLEGRIIQIRKVAAGQAVGYGGSFVTARPTKLATIGTGYADGVPRLLSNVGRVFVAGGYAPIVGRVSMDLTQVDVTDIDVAEGAWAEFIGCKVTVDEVAGHAQTLAYEIMTGLGPRSEKRYIDAQLS